METETADRIAARIVVAARHHAEPIAATDGDGTLWSGDVGDDLFFALCDAEQIDRSMHAALASEARAHGVDDGGTASELARRLFDAHAAGQFPEERMFELMACAFAGWKKADVDAFAREALAKRDIAQRLHRELAIVLERAAHANVTVVVVSASPRAAIDAALALTGFESLVTTAVAADAVFEDDVMLPDVVRPIPYAHGKLTTLRAVVGDKPLLAAFGDNAWDLAMLEAAVVPVAVRPKPRLRALAANLPRMTELRPHVG